MRLFLLLFNFAAFLLSIYIFKEELRHADTAILFAVFIPVWVLLLLNIGYIQTTPRTFSFRGFFHRFASSWKAASSDQQSST